MYQHHPDLRQREHDLASGPHDALRRELVGRGTVEDHDIRGLASCEACRDRLGRVTHRRPRVVMRRWPVARSNAGPSSHHAVKPAEIITRTFSAKARPGTNRAARRRRADKRAFMRPPPESPQCTAGRAEASLRQLLSEPDAAQCQSHAPNGFPSRAYCHYTEGVPRTNCPTPRTRQKRTFYKSRRPDG